MNARSLGGLGSVDPVRQLTVAQQVADRLMDAMRVGELAPGGRLPSERELCEEFGVARTSVREALQHLASMGVVERRSGRLFVVEHLGSLPTLGEGLESKVRELFETRRVIEVSMTEFAACRATEEQRKGILRLSTRFDGDLRLGKFRELDRRFHSAIADACGNPLMAELYFRLLDALFESPAFASLLYTQASQAEVHEIISQSGRSHVQIAQAVADGDPVRAAEAAEAHLGDVEQRLLEALR